MGKRLIPSRLFVTPAEVELLDRAAASLGVSRHKFMVDAATERAEVALVAVGSSGPDDRSHRENRVSFADPVATESAS